jgi:hypothetical protein
MHKPRHTAPCCLLLCSDNRHSGRHCQKETSAADTRRPLSRAAGKIGTFRASPRNRPSCCRRTAGNGAEIVRLVRHQGCLTGPQSRRQPEFTRGGGLPISGILPSSTFATRSAYSFAIFQSVRATSRLFAACALRAHSSAKSIMSATVCMGVILIDSPRALRDTVHIVRCFSGAAHDQGRGTAAHPVTRCEGPGPTKLFAVTPGRLRRGLLSRKRPRRCP